MMHGTKNPTGGDDITNPMLAARLEYAARRWWTFPAPADGSKKSLKSAERSGGVRWGATIDPEVIRKEFRSHRFRDQNVGIMCGVESGIFVIETDTAEHGDDIDGEAALNAWEVDNGALPPTLMARSPSGSVHRYFRHPGRGIKVKSFSAILGALIESSEVQWLAGDAVDLNTYFMAVNSQRRILTTLGLDRRTRDVTPPLAQYLAERSAAVAEDPARNSSLFGRHRCSRGPL